MMEYIKDYKKYNIVHMVLANVCYQFDEVKTLGDDASIFRSLLGGEGDYSRDLNGNTFQRADLDVVVLESTVNIKVLKKKIVSRGVY